MRIAGISLCAATAELDLELEVDGHQIRWTSTRPDRTLHHEVCVDGVSFRVSCGYDRLIERLRGMVGGSDEGWEMIRAVAWASREDQSEMRRRESDARQEGYRAAIKAISSATTRRDRDRGRPCYLYLMRCEGALKIGCSWSPKGRLIEFRVGRPGEIVLLAKKRFPNRDAAMEAESAAHAVFAHMQIRGEWFHDVPEIRAYFGI